MHRFGPLALLTLASLALGGCVVAPEQSTLALGDGVLDLDEDLQYQGGCGDLWLGASTHVGLSAAALSFWDRTGRIDQAFAAGQAIEIHYTLPLRDPDVHLSLDYGEQVSPVCTDLIVMNADYTSASATSGELWLTIEPGADGSAIATLELVDVVFESPTEDDALFVSSYAIEDIEVGT